MFVYLVLPVLIALVTLFCIFYSDGPKNLPPGPWGLPIIGHLPFIGRRPYKTLMGWKKKYGPIIYCRMGSLPTVFLCDPKVIKQAFNMAELSGRGDFDGVIPPNERKGNIRGEGPRQVEQRHFALTTLKDFGLGRKLIEGHIQEALGQFLNQIKTEGQDTRAFKSQNIATAYVIRPLLRILLTDKPCASEIEQVARLLEKLNDLGSILHKLAIFVPVVETLTKWVTFGRVSLYREQCRNYRATFQCMEVPIEKRKLSRVKGQPQNVVDLYLDVVDKTTDKRSVFHRSYNSVAYFVGDLVAAGVHTTSVTIEWMLLYMTSYPSIQGKLQEEIDRIVGPFRVPAIGDRPRMTFMDAAIHETLRLSSIIHLGVDHKALKDVILQDYRIPKGTLIFANLYGIHHDPEVWGPDVEDFKPERWLGEAGRKLKSSHMFAFSTGKRSCIGESMARDTLFIFITGIFQHFTVSFEEGCSGPGLESVGDVVLNPKPCNMVFHPRQDQ